MHTVTDGVEPKSQQFYSAQLSQASVFEVLSKYTVDVNILITSQGTSEINGVSVGSHQEHVRALMAKSCSLLLRLQSVEIYRLLQFTPA